jgi:beta-phosphoglucomutase
MKWIHDFQLFLFDFDGLLVNTEHLHLQAYENMLGKRGYRLGWSFGRFCELAHLNATAVREGIYAQFPDLEPNWEILYKEKKENYFQLLQSGKVELMPGVELLLKALVDARIRTCVVTNALFDQTLLIRSQIPLLKTIPHWVTREEYEKPKPSPECYLRAIQLYGEKGDRIVGFEDSVRGLEALRGTSALPVLICSNHHPLLEIATEGEVVHYESFEQIPSEWLVSL